MFMELAQFKNWLKCQYPNSSASVHYSSDLALFFSFVRKAPAKVKLSDVDCYIASSLKKGHRPSTINRRLSALRTFFYFLSITCDQPPTCPVLPRHRLQKSHPLPRDVSDPDIKTLFAQIDSTRDQAMFLLMLDCGLRVGEVHNLSLKDLHFENPSHILVNGKGGKQRIVYLSPPAQHVLQGWLASRPVSNGRAVFISEHGKRLSVAGIQYLLRGYCKKAGVQFSCHQLRHTFGRHMAEADLPVTSLQSLLGHKSIRTTQIYVHLSNTHLQAEYDRAISQKVVSLAVSNRKQSIKQSHFPKAKGVNWNGYLTGLPDWLTELLQAYCSRYYHAKYSVQQTRNLLSQLCPTFRCMLENSTISCLGDITPKLWFAYVESRQKAGVRPTTLNTTLRMLRSFLKDARESEYAICERMLEVRPLRTSELLPRDISEAQVNQLLKHADANDRAWILLMAHSGLRTCEIRALRWHDIDLKRRTVRIEESKGLRSRIVFMSSPTLKAFRKLPKTIGCVFTYDSQPLSSRYCQSRLGTIGKKCGIHVSPHQLRSTCATLLINAGMSIFGVQAILGHQFVDTTLQYARTYAVTVAKDYQQAIKVLEGNKSARSLL
jgi:site-specific recombinase XerD